MSKKNSRKPAIPAVLVVLGRAVELEGSDFSWSWTKKDKMILSSNTRGSRLYITPAPTRDVKISKPDKAIKKAKQLYRTFSPKGHNYSAAVGKASESLQKRGWVASIVYESDKFGKTELYVHDFETLPRAWANKITKPSIHQ